MGSMTSGGSRVSLPRLHSLTSLRFFAAALVLVHHASMAFTPGGPVQRIANVGFVGVEFFFILSGFVLMWSYRPMPLRYFYGRRVARIGPLHLLTALAAVPVLLLIGQAVEPLPSVLNVLLLQSWVPVEAFGASLNPVDWTLSCEAFFYLMFPFFARRIGGWNLRRAALVVVFGVLVTVALVGALLPLPVAQEILYKAPWFRIGGFLLGMMLAEAFRRGYRARVSMPVALAALVVSYGAATFAGTAARFVGLADVRAYADLVMVPAVLLLIAAAASSDLAGKAGVLHRPWLVWLGDASFALYIIHYLPLLVMSHFIGVLPQPVGLALLVVFCAASVAASVIVYKRVEYPLEEKLRRRIGTAPVAGASTPATVR